MLFNRHPRGTDPIPALQFVSSFIEDILERTLGRSRRQEEMDGLVECATGFVSRPTGAHDIKRHRVSHKLIAFFPDMNGVYSMCMGFILSLSDLPN